jgi:hypothetical protein
MVAQPGRVVESFADVTTPIIATLPRYEWLGPFGVAVAVAGSATDSFPTVEVKFLGP